MPHAAAARRLPSRRWTWVLVVLGLVVAALVLYLVVGRDWQTSNLISRLGGEGSAHARKELLESNWKGTDTALEAAMRDEDRPFVQRVEAASLLVDRQRHRPVEDALRDERLDLRTVALTALRQREWFDRYLREPETWPVRATLLEWVQQDGDRSRAVGIQIVQGLALREATPYLLPLVRRSDAPGAPSPSTIVAAAQALAAFGECSVVAPLVPVAQADPNDDVRRSAVDLVYRLARGPRGACRDALPPEQVRDLLHAALDGGRVTRMTAHLHLAAEPEWARAAEERLRRNLEEGDDGAVRRGAMGALAAGGSEAFVRDLPRWFHAPDPYLRSEAVSSSSTVAAPDARAHWAGCWIGILENETGSEFAVIQATGFLRDLAGQWVGLPATLTDEPMRRDAEAFQAARDQFRREMFHAGESHGLARADWAERWWRWFAASQGLTEAQVEEAWRARQAFWAAARKDDVAAARRVLDGRADPPGLFCYEEGWLRARG